MILDSNPKIYAPSYLSNDDTRDLGAKRVTRSGGLHDFFNYLEKGKTKGVIIFSPDPHEFLSSDNQILLSIKNLLSNKKNEERVVLSENQRNLVGVKNFETIFSFVLTAENIYDNKYSCVSNDVESPLISKEKDYAPNITKMLNFTNETRNVWQYKLHSDITLKNEAFQEYLTSFRDVKMLQVDVFGKTDGVIEKRNIVLLRILLNYHAREGFDNIVKPFNDIIQNYNKIKKTSIYTDNLIMIPWKKDIMKAAQVKYGHVLIYGESGSGKESTAELIHFCSHGFENQKIKKVNCALIDKSLATSILFGHKKGAFTNAHQDVEGILKLAEEGSLFLDEIHHLPAETLGKLLRFMEDGVITKLGGSKLERCNVKIIAATNENDFEDNNKLKELGFIQRFQFKTYIPPVRHRLDRGSFELIIESTWEKAIADYEKEQKVKIGGAQVDIYELLKFMPYVASGPFQDGRILTDEQRVNEFIQNNKDKLNSEEISTIFKKTYMYKCFSECYKQTWKNTNMRGIYNYMLNSIISYALHNPHFIYKRNVDPSATGNDNSAVNTVGRKYAVEFDELYELMMDFKKQNKNGVELQKEISTKYGALEKKNSLNNYLQRHKTKYKSNMSVLEKIEELRNTLRTDGCFANYPV